MFNTSDNEYIVEIGNRIAQLITEKCNDVKFIEYKELPDLYEVLVLEKLSMQFKVQLSYTIVYLTH